MPPPRLPALPPGPLSLAAARERGITDRQWRNPALIRHTRSVRSTQPLTKVVERARTFAAALPPDVAFSHVTAAQLWTIPLPSALESQEPLDVIRESRRAAVERRGCLSHRGAERRSLVVLEGLRVTSLVDTWVDLGEVMPRGLSFEDLVVAGDTVASRSSGPADAVDRLRKVLDARVRPRHGRDLRAALALVRPGVRSPMETRARLMFHRAGFPEPEVNGAIHADDGGWLAEGDLVWRAQRVVGEYQGAVHAGIRARSYDAQRNGLLADEGWNVLEVFADDVFDAPRRVVTLRRFAMALGLDLAQLRLA